MGRCKQGERSQSVGRGSDSGMALHLNQFCHVTLGKVRNLCACVIVGFSIGLW